MSQHAKTILSKEAGKGWLDRPPEICGPTAFQSTLAIAGREGKLGRPPENFATSMVEGEDADLPNAAEEEAKSLGRQWLTLLQEGNGDSQQANAIYAKMVALEATL